MKTLRASTAILMALLTLSSCSGGPILRLARGNAPGSAAAPTSQMQALEALDSVVQQPLSLERLPAAGFVDLGTSDENALKSLGLGGSLPACDPPSLPYNQSGLYWSERFSLSEGDLLSLVVRSPSPVSWFGVNWSPLVVRGALALTDTDEEGWNFSAVYPASSSVDTAAGTVNLILTYVIQETGDYQLVVKNADTLMPCRLSISVASTPGSPGQAATGER